MKFEENYIEIIREVAKNYNAKKVILFGSAISTPDDINDIDLACDIQGLDFFLFADKIENKLKMPVDVIPINNNDPLIEHIDKFGRLIYEA